MVAAIPFALVGLVIGALVALIFRVIPASWLLDYGDADASVAIKAQLGFTFFPAILLLMLADAFLFWCSRQIIGLNPLLPVVLYIAQPLLLIIISDLKTRIIPDQFILALIPGGMLLWAVDGFKGETAWWSGLLLRLLAGLLGGLVLWGCGWLAGKLMKREAMGMGDVKLLAACSFVIGLNDLPFLFCISFLLAAIVAIPVLVSRLWRRDASPEIAFGPYIALSTLLLLLFNEQIYGLWQSYVALLP
ncbi:MAG: A24 family peptidase [Bacillota bacterium]|nr:A24 family peptidase [Bacillota bacterium]